MIEMLVGCGAADFWPSTVANRVCPYPDPIYIISHDINHVLMIFCLEIKSQHDRIFFLSTHVNIRVQVISDRSNQVNPFTARNGILSSKVISSYLPT